VTGNFEGVVGAEYYLPVGIGFSVMYMGGISNVINHAEPGESMHTQDFNVSIAYKLNSLR
jgi:hypothetical protein